MAVWPDEQVMNIIKYLSKCDNWVTHHDWCGLTLKSNSLFAQKWLLHQKAKLGQRGIKSNIFLRTKGFIAMDKIMSNLFAYKSGAFGHLAVGLGFKRRNIFFHSADELPTKWPSLGPSVLDFKSISNSIFAGYTGSKNQVRNRLKIKFVQLYFSKI